MPQSRKQKQKHTVHVVWLILFFLFSIVASVLLIEYLRPGTFIPERESTSSLPGDLPASTEVLTLNHTGLTLYVGTTGTLILSPEGVQAAWVSDNEAAATVVDGKVTAKAPGTAVITAQASDGQNASCTVTVIPLPEVTVSNPAGVSIDDNMLQALRDLTAQNPLGISLYYRDVNSGVEIEYNSLKKYGSGSVVKAPYCKWLISSGADMDEVITKSDKDNRDGEGAVTNLPAGSQVTVRELVRAALVESDNTAYGMLVSHYGFEGFLSYAKSLGVGADQKTSNIFGTMSAAGAGVYFTNIYNWGQNAPEQSKEFLDFLCNTSYRKLISSVTDAPVAHKYGWNGGHSGFHDAAVVYSEHPYVLTIFTSLDANADGTVGYIQKVASCLNSINGNQ